MSNCIYGSKKRDGSPEQFTINTGAICFLLGLDNVICPLLDKIPSVVGKPWKEIIKTVAKEGLGLAVDQLTGQIETQYFCERPAPPPPSDINYIDVFDFIASYVPPLSIVASGDGLLKKITSAYLHQKWYDLCECKKPEKDNSPAPSSPFSPACPASSALKEQVDAFVARSYQNLGNKGYAIVENTTDNLDDFPRGGIIFQSSSRSDAENRLDEVLRDANYSSSGYTKEATITGFDYIDYIGCVKITRSTYSVSREGTVYTLYDADGNDGRYIFFYEETQAPAPKFFFDDSDCCPDPPPAPDPQYPLPPQNCVPTPPPKYCELFPDDPLCSNVSPASNGNCEEIEIEVDDYDCADGSIKKKVKWRL